MAIRAIFFDIDNTLYDSSKLTSMARRNSVLAMIDAGLSLPEEKILKDLNRIIEEYGPNYGKHYDELLKKYGRSDVRIVAAGVVAYEHTKIAYLKPFPRVVSTLMELKKRYKLAVVSNGLSIKQWEKLVGLGLHHLFDVVITSEECRCEKPRAEIFQAGLRALKVEASESVMVGDRYDVDIVGAKKAGLHTVQLKKDGGKGPYEITSFAQLIEAIEVLENEQLSEM